MSPVEMLSSLIVTFGCSLLYCGSNVSLYSRALVCSAESQKLIVIAPDGSGHWRAADGAAAVPAAASLASAGLRSAGLLSAAWAGAGGVSGPRAAARQKRTTSTCSWAKRRVKFISLVSYPEDES